MSLWWALTERPNFSKSDLSQDWDVVIVGGGFSGLWTAHHLVAADPSLKIAVLEKDRVGSGASGRNGGWISALYPMSDAKMLDKVSHRQIALLHKYLRNSIDEIANFIETEKMDCGFHKGGSLTIALNGGQLKRLKEAGGNTLLDRSQTAEQINMAGALAAEFTRDCASVNPAALLVGLSRSLVNSGVSIFETTEATIDAQKDVYVHGKKIKTSYVVRAMEAYVEKTRAQIPIYSLVIATDSLPDSLFDDIGIRNHQTFAEASHLVTYAQRTQDNRLVIGGRGAPYSWGSQRNDAMESRSQDHQRLRRMAMRWFPRLQESDFAYAWGGAVAVTRDWSPYLRHGKGYAEMGGYVGDGLTLSYLLGATMADVIRNQISDRVELPFVQWKNPKWEYEPLRWIGVNAGIKVASLADREEFLTQRPSRLMRLATPLLGH